MCALGLLLHLMVHPQLPYRSLKNLWLPVYGSTHLLIWALQILWSLVSLNAYWDLMNLTFFFIYEHNMFCVCGSSFIHAVHSLQDMGGGPLVSFPNALEKRPSLDYSHKWSGAVSWASSFPLSGLGACRVLGAIRRMGSAVLWRMPQQVYPGSRSIIFNLKLICSYMILPLEYHEFVSIWFVVSTMMKHDPQGNDSQLLWRKWHVPHVSMLRRMDGGPWTFCANAQWNIQCLDSWKWTVGVSTASSFSFSSLGVCQLLETVQGEDPVMLWWLPQLVSPGSSRSYFRT